MYPYDNMLMHYGDKGQFTTYGTMFINDTVVNGLHPYLFMGNGTILDGWMETGNDTAALSKVLNGTAPCCCQHPCCGGGGEGGGEGGEGGEGGGEGGEGEGGEGEGGGEGGDGDGGHEGEGGGGGEGDGDGGGEQGGGGGEQGGGGNEGGNCCQGNECPNENGPGGMPHSGMPLLLYQRVISSRDSYDQPHLYKLHLRESHLYKLRPYKPLPPTDPPHS
ncbi:hypothetical protein GGF42_008639 [Coemansia sp. RSA 2424]|nr:hypothetical protein GGF42_008639 [Coemansia sp. RSA 2424]